VEQRSKIRVLLVEDNEINRRVLMGLLRALGFEVDVACGAVQALKIYDDCRGGYDVVLTDLYMPQMGGDELIKQLKERAYDSQPKIAVISAALSGPVEELAAAAAGWGADAFIAKPVTRAQLSAFFEGLLSDE